MADERPAKKTIRELWLKAILDLQSENEYPDEPLYLTMPGGRGLELDLLVERGFLRTTEVGSIQKEDQWKVVAVENSQRNVLELQERFPGLKILDQPIQSLVRGAGLTAWPSGDDRRFCRAAVINLDINARLEARCRGSLIEFPVLLWIRKLVQLHDTDPPRNWTLLLTLHGQVAWDARVWRTVSTFFTENCEREATYAEALEAFLGPTLVTRLKQREVDSLQRLRNNAQQRVVGAYVPKQLASHLQSESWAVETEWTCLYGGTRNHAPMVAWRIAFTWEPQAAAEPDRFYRMSLTSSLRHTKSIAEDGSISN